MNWTSKALWIVRILVACRVSALSVLGGALLFLMSIQARDLFADLTFGILPKTLGAWGHWLWFFVCLVFVWAFPVHYAARAMLRSDAWMFSCRVRAEVDPRKALEVRRDLKGAIKWIPRLLAALPFAAVLIGLWKAHAVVAQTMALEPARNASGQILVLAGLDILIGAAFIAFLDTRRFLTRRMSTRVGAALAIAYAVAVTGLFVASLARPFFPADIAPRAATVPLLMGGFVFLGTYLAWLAHKYCIPFLALSVVAALWVTAQNVHFNDVRTLPSASDDFSKRQIDIGDAVERWKAANCDPRGCPPAVIVAAEGGASRAAFAAATAVGELLDSANDLSDGKDPARAIAPARRIFAISGVSGGSFGAATIRTALADFARAWSVGAAVPAGAERMVRRLDGRRDQELARLPAGAGLGRLSVARLRRPRFPRQFLAAEPCVRRLAPVFRRPRGAGRGGLGTTLRPGRQRRNSGFFRTAL